MAMQGYEVCEAAVLARIISRFPGKLTATNALTGDIDTVMEVVLANNEKFGFYLDYAGGEEDRREPFSVPVWLWKMVGVMLIRRTPEETIEADLRSVITTLALVFRDDHTLGGITPRAKVMDLGDAETITMNGFPFYWLPMMIEVIDR